MANEEDREAGAETDRDRQSKVGDVERYGELLLFSFEGSGSRVLIFSSAAFIVVADDPDDDEVGEVAPKLIRKLLAGLLELLSLAVVEAKGSELIAAIVLAVDFNLAC